MRRGELQLGTVVHEPKLVNRRTCSKQPSIVGACRRARLRVEVRISSPRSRNPEHGWSPTRSSALERDLHDGARAAPDLDGGSTCATSNRPAVAPARARRKLSWMRPWAHWAMRSRSFASSPAGSARPPSTRALGPALRELASRSPMAAEVRATDERFDGEIEAAAYFVANEALVGNTMKHAGGPGPRERPADTLGQ